MAAAGAAGLVFSNGSSASSIASLRSLRRATRPGGASTSIKVITASSPKRACASRCSIRWMPSPPDERRPGAQVGWTPSRRPASLVACRWWRPSPSRRSTIRRRARNWSVARVRRRRNEDATSWPGPAAAAGNHRKMNTRKKSRMGAASSPAPSKSVDQARRHRRLFVGGLSAAQSCSSHACRHRHRPARAAVCRGLFGLKASTPIRVTRCLLGLSTIEWSMMRTSYTPRLRWSTMAGYGAPDIEVSSKQRTAAVDLSTAFDCRPGRRRRRPSEVAARRSRRQRTCWRN